MSTGTRPPALFAGVEPLEVFVELLADIEGETDFYDRVVRTLSGVTIVMISHRLSSVRSADRIVLLEA